MKSKDNHKLIEALKNGGVAVVKTDTLYGLVTRADNQTAVAKVYKLKRRNPAKSLIVLIADVSQLYDWPKLDLSDKWPGPNSVILDSPSAPDWLKNSDGTVAYRLPDDDGLRQLLGLTGPLVAPSANLEGQPPAEDIAQAVDYFGDGVDVYVDEGEVSADQPPSKLWRLNNGEWERLR
ncbi:MAG TPA: L-threonylcarbamoyladenylate synthase [Candidatus Saccharimonadales bacterium]|nr:L-threonylcarbamoyladenylate synthase [Candidatus Saccharimonadales bacterium]